MLPDDRARADDRHLDHEVVEALGLHARQRGHLRAALDLEHADGVGLLQHAGRPRGRRAADGRDRRRARRARDQRHRVLAAPPSCRRPSRSTLMMPRSAQSSLSHWIDHAARHGGRLQRHHLVEAAGRDHHAARVLAEVARQVLACASTSSAKSRMRGVRRGSKPASAQLRRRARRRRDPDSPSRARALGEPVDCSRGQPERLAHLAHRPARAVGDDVGGHGGAARAVRSVDVLDHLLAPIARRQIEVDVGPLAALLGEEALEQQLHPHRIDGGDAERVADRAVGRRAAPLHQDRLRAGRTRRCPRRSGSSRRARASR